MERCDEVEATPDLEGTGGVVVFVLDVSLETGDLGKGLIVDKGGGPQVSIDHCAGPKDLLEGNLLRHGTLLRRSQWLIISPKIGDLSNEIALEFLEYFEFSLHGRPN
jgi:hypothetical protein